MIGVYGANGFIGCHLVRRLLAIGLPVRAVSRRFGDNVKAEFSQYTELVESDFGQKLEMAASLQGIDTVFQLISNSSPGLGNEHVIADINDNVILHVEFLRLCLQAGVKRIIFISSGGTVYGPDAPIPTSEFAICNPISSHGITKLFVEKYIQMYGHQEGLEYVILRLSNPYGPGQEFRRGQGLIPAIIRQYKMNQSVKVYGGGIAKRDYIHIDDVINAMEMCLSLEGKPQLLLNIGSGKSRSVLEVIDTIEEVTGYEFKCEHVAGRPTDVYESRLDISRAGIDLNWKPSIKFKQGLAGYLGE